MSYRIDLHEGVASGVRRAVAEQLERAVAELQDTAGNPGEAVHEARKRLKKSRSALRLVRFDLPAKVRAQENEILRDVGRKLSGVRDAQVLIETLDELREQAGRALPEPPVRELRKALEKRLEQMRLESLPAEEREALVAELKAVQQRARDWKLGDESFKSARRGIERIHRRGRRAMRRALKKADDESWHELRKRVKDLWYSTRLLRPIAPAQLGGVVGEAKALSDVLGKINDLAVLRRTIEEHAGDLYAGDAQALRRAVERRSDELRRAAVPIARRLYDEPSDLFAKRLRRWWGARDSQAAADAQWVKRKVAKRARKLLEAKASADAAQRRKLRDELRRIGFSASELSKRVSSGDGGFSVGDFDKLIKRGAIRVGKPPKVGR